MIPTGTPDDAKAKTSKLVKSGFLNYSTSKLLPHGKCFNKTGANYTNLVNNTDYFLLTTETKPSN